MRYSWIVCSLLTVMLYACTGQPEAPPAGDAETMPETTSPESQGPRFLAHHLFNLPAEQEGLLMEIIGEHNAVFYDLGYPDVRYTIWRIAGDWEQQGEYRYVQMSIYPSREVYDQLHEAPEYKALGEKWADAPLDVVELYNRYEEVDRK